MTHSSLHRPYRPLFIVLAYAAFAGLWIIFSDQAVEWLFGTPAQYTLANTLKGGTFIVITSLLLYFLLQRHCDPRPVNAEMALQEQTNLRGLMRPLLVLSAFIIGITVIFSLNTLEQQKAAEVARLQAVSLLKAEQIAIWLKERQRDATLLQNSPFLADAYQHWHQHGDTASRDRLLERLNAHRKEGVFHGVVLLDAQGTQIWKASDRDRQHQQIAVAERDRILAAVAHENVSRIGPYLDTAGRIHLDYVFRLSQKGGEPGPIIVLHSDAGDFFPIALGAWPVPSASGEIFLFRREGNQVLYLSPLKHRSDAAMKLRLPLEDNRLPVAQVINDPGKLGQMLEGMDYRGVEVAGIASAIPGTDWFLMTKLDRREMLADATRSVTWIAFSGLLALFVAGAGLVLFRQRQQIAVAQNVQQAQSERLRALRLLAAIADSSNDAIFALDDEGHFILVNRAAERITGQTQAAVIGRDESAMFPPEVAVRQMADNRRVMDSNVTLNVQEEIPSAEGNRIFLTTKGPLHDGDGHVIGLYGIGRDITERTRLENELHERAASFRTLAEQIPAILYRANLDEFSQTTYISPRVRELGYTQEEWLAQPDIWLQSLHPDDLPRVLAGLEAFRSEGGTLSLEYRLRTRAGEWRHYQDEAETVFDKAGNPLYLQGIMLDVTQARQAEHALQAAFAEAQHFREALDHVTAFIYMKDTHSRYLYANQPTLDLFRCTAADLPGSDDSRFFPPETVSHLHAVDARVLAGETTEEEIETVTQGGEHRVFWEVKTPIYTNAERTAIWGLCGISTDITARKAAEALLQRQTEELHRRNEELERFNQLTVGRELDMIKLKQQINALSQRLGQAPPYSLAFLDSVVAEFPELRSGGQEKQEKKP